MRARQPLAARRAAVATEEKSYALISPTAFSLLAIIPLLLSIAIPVDVYMFVMRENDVMHYNVQLIVFYCACIACHIVGIQIAQWMARTPYPIARQPVQPKDLLIVMVAPLGIAILLQVLSLAITIKNSPELIGLLLSGQGQEAKKSINTEGALSQAQPLLIIISSWAMFRYLTLRDELTADQRFIIRGMVQLAIFLSIFGTLIKAARYEAIPLLLSLLVIWIRTSKAAGSAGATLAKFFIGGFGVIGVFLGFSALRGFSSLESAVYTLMGYGPASFNRLAAMLQGWLSWPYGGTGTYAVPFLYYIPVLHNLVDTGAMMGASDAQTVFLSEFSAVSAAGLNQNMIWSTAWGYLYSDLGRGVFPFAAAMGLFTGFVWVSFRRGGTLGAALYPYISSTIVLWISSELLTRPTLNTELGAVLVLKICEELIPYARWRYSRKPQEVRLTSHREKRRQLVAARRRLHNNGSTSQNSI